MIDHPLVLKLLKFRPISEQLLPTRSGIAGLRPAGPEAARQTLGRHRGGLRERQEGQRRRRQE